MSVVEKIKNKVIISVQAMPSEPLYNEVCMKAMMSSVVKGGAQALRLAGERDIKNAKEMFKDIIVIGLTKPDVIPKNWMSIVYITPAIEDARLLINAGADIIAFDGTSRPRPKEDLRKLIKYIKMHNKVAMADVSTVAEGIAARALGADIISTTLSGYTQESKSDLTTPDFDMLEKLVKVLNCPVVLEGRIWTVEEVNKAFELGAHAVVIGSAVTRPQLITKRFCSRGLKK